MANDNVNENEGTKELEQRSSKWECLRHMTDGDNGDYLIGVLGIVIMYALKKGWKPRSLSN